MNTTGMSRALRDTCRFRPMRCWRARERQRSIAPIGEHFAVEHGAIGRTAAASLTSGKRSVISSSPRDHKCRVPAALDQLRADAVPFPLHLPALADRPELWRCLSGSATLVLHGRGQAERIRTREVDRAHAWRDHRRVPVGATASSRPSAGGDRRRRQAPPPAPAREPPVSATRPRATHRSAASAA